LQPVAATLARGTASKGDELGYKNGYLIGCVEGAFNRVFGGRENVLTFNLVIDTADVDVVMWYRFGWRTVSKCERVSDWGPLE
jgi:hypothetical protein